MAIRRNIGVRIGDLADILLKNHLQQKNYGYENDLLTARQKALSDQNATEAILKQALGSPKFAAQLNKANPNFSSGGIGIGSFAPNGEDASGDVATAIANNPERPYTPESIDALYHAAPGAPSHVAGEDPTTIDTLMAQKKAQDAAALARVIAQTKPEQQQSIGAGPNGEAIQQSAFVNPYQQMGQPPVQMSKTGAQEGQFAGNKELGTLTTPGLTPAKITAHNLLTLGTSQANASAEGAKARATTPPHIEPQFDSEGNPTPPVRINPWSGPATSVEDASPIQGIAGLQAQKAQQDKIGNLHATLDRVDKLLEQAKAYNLTGPIGGRIADFMGGKVGTTGDQNADRLFGRLKLDMQSVPAQIALGLGEGARGAGSVRMLENWKPLFSLNGPDVMQGAVAETRLLLPKKTIGTQPAAPANAPRRIRYDAQGNPLPN